MSSQQIEEREFIYPEGYAEQIAVAVNSWAYLEHNINRAVWELAGTRSALGACMTAQIGSITGRLNALVALMNVRKVPAKLIKRVNKFCEEVRGATEFRNRIVHDPWFMTNPRGELAKMKITAQRSLTYDIQTVPLTELARWVKVIEKNRSEFSRILNEIQGSILSLPDIPESTLDPITYNLRVRQNSPTETQ